ARHRGDTPRTKRRTSMPRSRLTILNLMLIIFFMAIFLSLGRYAPGPEGGLYVLGFVLLIPFLLGPILVQQTQWVANEFEFDVIDPEGPEMPKEASKDHRQTVAALAPLGFAPVLCYKSRKLTPNAFSFSTLFRNA